VVDRCATCGRGTLLLVGRPGRVVWRDGAAVEVPRDFLIPTCDQCGAEKLDAMWALRSARTEKMEIIGIAAPVSFAVGELVDGTYEIARALDRGRMGTVYEAHDRGLGRLVALKIARSELSLRTEAHALAAVRHPSLMTVHALGRHRGVEFVVMELIRGTTLERYMQEHVLTIRQTVEILIAISEGLAALHAVGISHGGVEPANVMLAPGDRAVLMDFGLGQSDGLVDLNALGVIAGELVAAHPPGDVPAELASLITDRPRGIEDVLGRLRAVRERRRFTVLIVDDDGDFAETLRAIVRAAVPDADVSVARDGQAALASLVKKIPTVMLLDLNMPRMNGLELCMALRGGGLAADCEIISVNGSATPRDRQILEHLGVRQSLPKTPAISRAIIDLMQISKRRWLSAAAG
jgi:CheY-like chemotaxis protein/tRNA A-37 threonylcarbamoyl transferase component Bud32